MTLLDKLLDAAEQDGGLILSADDVMEILGWINDGEIDLDMEDASLGDVAFHMDGKKAN